MAEVQCDSKLCICSWKRSDYGKVSDKAVCIPSRGTPPVSTGSMNRNGKPLVKCLNYARSVSITAKRNQYQLPTKMKQLYHVLLIVWNVHLYTHRIVRSLALM